MSAVLKQLFLAFALETSVTNSNELIDQIAIKLDRER